MDEIFEALTLIQTNRIKPFPVILFGSSYWGGLLEWVRSTLLPRKYIYKEDMDLVSILDDVDEVVRLIKRTVIV